MSDIRLIRKSFTIEQQPAENEDYYRLKLLPREPTQELAYIILSVAKQNYQIDQVVSHNAYGDETRIGFSDFSFDIDPADDLFRFTIPAGADVVQMDQF